MICGGMRGVPAGGIIFQLFEEVGDLLHLLVEFDLFFALTVSFGLRCMCVVLVLLVLSGNLIRAPLYVRATARFLGGISSTSPFTNMGFALLCN